MKVSVTVCDVCGEVGAEAEKYEVKQPSGRTAFDLCKEHSEPLRNLVAQFPKSKPLGRPAASSAASATKKATTRKRTSRVVTMDDVAKAKKA